MIKINHIDEYSFFLDSLLDSLVTAVFIVNRNNELLAYNHSFQTIFHSSEDITPGFSTDTEYGGFCDGTEQCNACRLRDSLVEAFTYKFPVTKERITRKFFVSGREITKYFLYSSKILEINNEEIKLVIVDDISGEMEARLQLKRLSVTDELTQLYNHKYLYSKLEEELARTRRYGNLLSIIMLDIDHFKKINDRFGHVTGDDVLVAVSNLIKMNLRDIDLAGRYDSVEFMIILPQTNLENTYKTAERIRLAVAEHLFPQQDLNVTVSGSVAELQPSDKNALFLFDRAENLLFKAKENGRNRIEK